MQLFTATNYASTQAPKQYSHYDTPQKARVQGAHEYMLAKGIRHDPRDVFEHFTGMILY